MKGYLRPAALAAALAAGAVLTGCSPQGAETSARASGKTTVAASATKTTVLRVSGMT